MLGMIIAWEITEVEEAIVDKIEPRGLMWFGNLMSKNDEWWPKRV